MTNLLCLTVGLIPLILGYHYIFKPRKMARVQTRFRKRIEKLEKRLIKAHRVTGLSYVLVGTVLLLTFFHPAWIYNGFLITRLALGFFFPNFFAPLSNVQPVATQWI